MNRKGIIACIVFGVMALSGWVSTLLYEKDKPAPTQPVQAEPEPKAVQITDVTFRDGTISGVLRNDLLRNSWFQVRFSILDAAGNKLRSVGDRIEGLGRGETWKFKVHYFDREAALYQFEGVWTKHGEVGADFETRAEAKAKAVAAASAYVPKSDRNFFDAQHAERLSANETALKEAQQQSALEKADREEKAAAVLAISERRRGATTARVVSYQHQQASNGLGSFQFEIGKRYLHGDGLPQDQPLARFWLTSACTNGLSEATNLLRTMSITGAK